MLKLKRINGFMVHEICDPGFRRTLPVFFVLKGENVTKEKVFLKKGILLSAFALTCLVFCSNPTKQSLRWRTNLELPISNTNFILSEQMPDLFKLIKDSTISISMSGINDSTVDGVYDTSSHTIAFSATHKDTFSFEQKQDTMSDKTFEVNIGPIPLSSAGNISSTVPFGVAAGVHPADVGPLTVSSTVTLDKIRQITFDPNPANAQLSIRLTNSTGVDIDSLTLSFLNILPSAPSQYVGPIAAGTFRDITINAAGNTIYSTVQTQVRAKLKAGTVSVGASLGVAIILTGTKANSVIVLDSLINVADTFANNYKITDSIRIDYADIKYGFFNYLVNNNTGLQLAVSAIHHDLWMTPVCINNNVTTVDSLHLLATPADTFNYYSGVIMQGERDVLPHSQVKFAQLNLSGNRMFPQWLDSNSVTQVDYFVRTVPTGTWDTLNAGDSLVFTIKPAALSYGEMAGTLVKDYQKSSDTQTVAIPFPFPENDRDSLRGKFELKRVIANMTVATSLPDSAFLGKLNVNFRVVALDFPGTITDTNIVLGNVKKDTSYNRALVISNVVNNFPDSVKILTNVTVPKGTKIRAINDRATAQDVGTMTVKSFVDYKLNAYFDWTIHSLTTMDLSADTFTIDKKSVELARRMENRTATFDFDVFNHTNVFISLYALFAPDSLRAVRLQNDTLVPTGLFNDMVLTPGLAETNGYVNILGTNGVYIPVRNGDTTNSVALDNDQLDTILNTTKGALRWMVKFHTSPNGANDSLTNTDYINIKSSFHFEGVSNMDSITTSYSNK
jgi:hypothetical protein